jgi:hypothetical protein
LLYVLQLVLTIYFGFKKLCSMVLTRCGMGGILQCSKTYPKSFTNDGSLSWCHQKISKRFAMVHFTHHETFVKTSMLFCCAME